MEKKITKVLGIKDSTEGDAPQVDFVNDDDSDEDEDCAEGEVLETEMQLAGAFGVDAETAAEVPRGFFSAVIADMKPRARRRKTPSHQADPGRSYMLALIKLFQSRVSPRAKPE